MTLTKKIPEKTVERLCLYSRVVSDLEQKGTASISSVELGERTDLTDAQIRKDLSLFGQFGTSGRGYEISYLKDELNKILGKNKTWRLAIIGLGNLGSALLAYPGFKEYGFEIAAIFDNDLRKIGKEWKGLTIQDTSELVKMIHEKRIDIGIIAVPHTAAQEVAEKLVEARVVCILNFSPVRLEVPKEVRVRNVDLSMELEILSYYLANK